MQIKQVKQVKKVTRAGLDRFVTGQIKKGTRAPASFHKLKRVARDTATGLKVKGKSLKIPWALLLVLIPGLIAIYLAISGMKKTKDGMTSEDQPVNLRGKDKDTLLGLFGHGKKKDQVEPGRPFSQEP